jgi:hypothetical protein
MRSLGWVGNGVHDAMYLRSGQLPFPLPSRRTARRRAHGVRDRLYPQGQQQHQCQRDLSLRLSHLHQRDLRLRYGHPL